MIGLLLSRLEIFPPLLDFYARFPRLRAKKVMFSVFGVPYLFFRVYLPLFRDKSSDKRFDGPYISLEVPSHITLTISLGRVIRMGLYILIINYFFFAWVRL